MAWFINLFKNLNLFKNVFSRLSIFYVSLKQLAYLFHQSRRYIAISWSSFGPSIPYTLTIQLPLPPGGN